MTTGSLGEWTYNWCRNGNGCTSKKIYYRVYVIMGDGELNKGIIWEASLSSAHFNLNNLTVFVDNNGYQSGGKISDVSGLNNIKGMWPAFDWYCQEIDGHDFNQIIEDTRNAQNEKNKPSVIIAKTIKGKGIPFMENDNSWHKRVPTKEQLDEAIKILEESTR